MKILALGDSYTIGEGVSYLHSFPNQLSAILHGNNKEVQQLKIVAATGWTTDELIGPMEMRVTHFEYDCVTLLIGVNNQYRGRSVEEFAIHFEYLISRAIAYGNNCAKNVIAVSIPDWGQTPFNKDRSKETVSAEIDAYNAVVRNIATKHKAHFIDITPSTRANASVANFLATDQLHPSEKEYAIWAEKIATILLAN